MSDLSHHYQRSAPFRNIAAWLSEPVLTTRFYKYALNLLLVLGAIQGGLDIVTYVLTRWELPIARAIVSVWMWLDAAFS